MTQGLLLDVRATVEKGKLVVAIDAKNELSHEIYWLNRFWTMMPGGVAAWEARAPYRFELGGTVRLVYGPAPVPRNAMVNNRYIPHATRIPAGGVVHVKDEIALPMDEFSPFHPKRDDSPIEDVEANKLAVIAHWVSPGPGVSIEPSFIDKAYFFVKAPDQKVSVSLVVKPIDKVQVRRRKDTMTRPLLPGETGP